MTSSPAGLRQTVNPSNYLSMNGCSTYICQPEEQQQSLYLDPKEKELHDMRRTMEREGYILPPISMKTSNAFTEADIKALTPWRDQLLMKLILGQKPVGCNSTGSDSSNTSTEDNSTGKQGEANPKPLKIRRLKRGRNPQEIFKLTGIRNLAYFDFGPSVGYNGLIGNGSSGFEDIIFSMDQVNSGFQTIRNVVETILTTCLEHPLTSYSLTGRALQHMTEVRNGLPTQRAVMSDVGTSKLSIPEQLINGIADFLSTWLVEPELHCKGKPMVNTVRAHISKTCSRTQEKAKGKENKKRKLLSCLM